MSVAKYFRKELRANSLFLEHDEASDFYLTCWQSNKSALILLCFRTLIFIGCISTVIASMVITMQIFSPILWFIFLTHWGLIFNAVASGLAWVVSLRAYFVGPIDSSLELPWYVKAYWAMYNTAIPIAFLITLFYWTLLTGLGAEDYGFSPVLDVFIHGINSVLMFALIVTSRHPTRLLHFYWSVGFSIVYLIFSIIFYFAGGISPFGTSWIYPMLDWEEPAVAVVVTIGCALGLIVLHFFAVAITVCRDKLTRRYRDTNSLPISRYN